MKKVIRSLFILFTFIVLASPARAVKYYTNSDDPTKEVVPDFAYVIGHSMFSSDFPYTEFYDGAVKTDVVILGAASITPSEITSRDQLIIYLNLGDGDWVDSKTYGEEFIDDVPEYFDIYYINGSCVDPICFTDDQGYKSVTFRYKDADSVWQTSTVRAKIGSPLAASAIPTIEYRPGYEFKQWTLQGETDPYDFDTIITDNITLEADWTPITYTITYDSNGGSTVNPPSGLCNLSYFDTKNCIAPPAPTKTGYTFKGWSLTDSASVNENDLLKPGKSIEGIIGADTGTTLTFHAIWEANVYNINYHLNGGDNQLALLTGTLPGTYTYSTTNGVTLPTTITRTGYTFNGWYDNANLEGTPITTTKSKTGNLNLYAKWTTHTFTVNYMVSGATYGQPQTNCAYNSCTVSVPNPSVNGFEYWKDNRGYIYKLGSPVNTTDASITLTAVLVGEGGNSNMRGLDLRLNDSDDLTHRASYEGTPVLNYITGVGTNLPSPKRTGYVFTGWNTKADGSGTPYTVVDTDESEDLVLYAQWSRVNVVVSYDLNGGSLSGTSATSYTCYLYNADCKAPGTPTLKGYEFKGWSLTTDASDLITGTGNYKDIILKNSGTLYLHAIYEKVVHRISYNLDGGNFEGTDVNSVPYTASLAQGEDVITFVKPVKYGWVFKNWESDELTNITQTSGKLKDTIGNEDVINVTATWERKTLSIDYNPNNGQANQGNTGVNCYYNSCVINVANPSNGTKTFEYWYDETNGYVFKRGEDIGGFYDIGDLTNDTVHLKAVYSGYQYQTISYDVPASQLNQNNVIKKYVVGVGANLPTPKRDGYTFAGWSLPGNSNRLFSEIPATATTDYENLVANWTPNTYNVIYVLDGGTNGSGNKTTFTSDDEDISLAPPSKTNYSFNGWTIGNDSGFELEGAGNQNYVVELNAYKDLVLIANWKNDKYNIIYDLDGGTEPSTPNPTDFVYTSGGWSQTLRDPSRTGYTFDGWVIVRGTATLTGNTLSINTRNDVYLKAKWNANPYTINYSMPQGATLEGPSANSFKTGDTEVTVSKATKPGYTFNGWDVTPANVATYNSSTGKVTISRNENFTLTANMTANAVTVEYCEGINETGQCTAQLEGFTNPTGMHYGDSLELPAAPNNSLANRFIYWMTNDGRFVSAGHSIQLTGNIVIYPYYVNFDKFHSITYNTNGGTFVNGDALTKFYEGDTFTLDASIVKEGYVFLGWYSEPEFTNPINSVVGQDTDLVLYAKWGELAPCSFVPEVIVKESTNTVTVSFDNVSGITSEHYPASVVAYYPNSHTSDPRTFTYGDTIVPEFDYELGMYIEVECNDSLHTAVTVEEDDFSWIHTVTLHYSGGNQDRTTTVDVEHGDTIPTNTYLYSGYLGDRYYSDYTWYIDTDHNVVYNNDGVTASFDLYGVRNN